MPISIVGTNVITGSNNNGADVVLTLPTLAQNDYVFIIGGHPDDDTAYGPTGAYGYTEVYHRNPGSSGVDVGLWYKKMGASPDTDVTCQGGGTSTNAVSYGALCLRGVDGTDPFDGTVDYTTAASVNPASITTQTDGAWVFVGTASDANDAAPGTITNYETYTSGASTNDTTDQCIGVCARVIATATTEDPGAWSDLSGSNYFSITTALKPGAVAPQNIDVYQAFETDTGQAVGSAKAKGADYPTEADTAQVVGREKKYALGQAWY